MVALLLASCQTLNFYTQAVGGQMEILRKSHPNGPIIASKDTDAKLRKQLVAVENIRRFASDHLSLPGHDSYGKYADLGREYVTWTLYAAPEFSLEPKRWWYPTLGELDYRGFFKEADAEELAKKLRAEGYDVQVGGVDAYSTLGWFHDPVLNTFVHSADVDLAELIFHELTHRKYFRSGATVFNESFSNAVAEDGVKIQLEKEPPVVAEPASNALGQLKAMVAGRRASSREFRQPKTFESAAKHNVPSAFVFEARKAER